MAASVVPDRVLDRLCHHLRSSPPGAVVEVGVYQGGSALRLWQVCQEQSRRLFLYDTFKGIPHKQDIDHHKVGDFADTSYDAVRALFPPEVKVVPGLFPDSAVPMPTLAFIHLDCDQYRSVKDSFMYLEPLLCHGGIVWFDDAPILAGAMLAARECCGEDLQTDECGRMYWVKP